MKPEIFFKESVQLGRKTNFKTDKKINPGHFYFFLSFHFYYFCRFFHLPIKMDFSVLLGQVDESQQVVSNCTKPNKSFVEESM